MRWSSKIQRMKGGSHVCRSAERKTFVHSFKLNKNTTGQPS